VLKPKGIADSFRPVDGRLDAMMGQRQVDQAALFYELERHVPATDLLRSIDCFFDLSDIRRHLVQFYSSTGGPQLRLLVRTIPRAHSPTFSTVSAQS
jgi:hypothetical protein